MHAYEDKTAYALCIFAYSTGNPDDEIMLFKGKVPGKIVEARGSNDFGWDPCFQPDGFDQTYAEMDSTTKDAISHRYKAVEAMKKHFCK